MAGEHAGPSRLVVAPQAAGLVKGAGDEVRAQRTPFDVPDDLFVAAVNGQALPGFH